MKESEGHRPINKTPLNGSVQNTHYGGRSGGGKMAARFLLVRDRAPLSIFFLVC